MITLELNQTEAEALLRSTRSSLKHLSGGVEWKGERSALENVGARLDESLRSANRADAYDTLGAQGRG